VDRRLSGGIVAPSQVVILGAGRGVRGGLPSAVVDIDHHGRVMDWLLDAFRELDPADVCFVGGFKAEEVAERYPDVRMVLNRDWARTGPVRSLGLAPLDTARPTFVCYSDVVFRRPAVAALRDGAADVVLAVDSTWRARYDGRRREDLEHAEKVAMEDDRVLAVGTAVDTDTAAAEFAGLLRLAPAAATAAFAAIRAGRFPANATLPALVEHLIELGLTVATVDLAGEWAELDAKQDLARFVLGTKAESLERLRALHHGGEIGDLVAFTQGEWLAAPDAVVARVLEGIPGERLIVRSSARNEDGWSESAAGRYVSVLDVDRTAPAIRAAVDEVLASYSDSDAAHQVLVQEMLRDVALSGVVMTRTLGLDAPYYVVNFDDRSSRTDTVTGGSDARTVFLHRDSPPADGLPAGLAEVRAAVQHIEKLVGHDSLDIEFAVTGGGEVRILQVRPIAVGRVGEPVDDEQVARALTEARRFLARRLGPSPTLVGRSTRFSVMSDWNPAEIVGVTPRRLALSLYRHLVTDEVWARQRAEYGYRDVRPCPLLVEVAGHPYVDVRASFGSFVPATLPDELAARLVDHWLARLAQDPSRHDKVEFEVLVTCLTADFARDAATLRDAGFAAADVDALRAALTALTAAGIARLDGDLARLPGLGAEIDRIERTGAPPLDRAYLHLEAVRRVGTPTFAHLARGAFVATALLRSLVRTGTITVAELDSFLASIDTVLGRLQVDARRVHDGALTWDAFVATYGHLRPGTYDIASPCYRAAAEDYLRPIVERAAEPVVVPPGAVWSAPTRRAVGDALARAGLPGDVERFEAFARRAIAGREEGKFVFTRGLSAALECFAEFGRAHGLGREDLAHVGVHDLLSCRDAVADPEALLASRALEGREAFHVAQGVALPAQITRESDLVCFEQEPAEPNFVTQHTVVAPVVSSDLRPDGPVDGTIVLIPNADPGYDWLLARDIAGLVTMYGGANSHMAVRAAELSLPAAIGVGELVYRTLEPARVLQLDCASRTVAVVH
jgi:choline kinase